MGNNQMKLAGFIAAWGVTLLIYSVMAMETVANGPAPVIKIDELNLR